MTLSKPVLIYSSKFIQITAFIQDYIEYIAAYNHFFTSFTFILGNNKHHHKENNDITLLSHNYITNCIICKTNKLIYILLAKWRFYLIFICFIYIFNDGFFLKHHSYKDIQRIPTY